MFGTLAHYPVEQARASLSNAFKQLKQFNITQDFNESLLGLLRLTATRHSDRTMRVLEIVPNIKVCLPQGRACDYGRFLSVLSRVQFAAVVAALVFLAVRAFRWVLRGRQARQAADGNDRLTLFGLLLVAGVLINAAVCGALAGPYWRYQTRLIWLVPMAAILLADRGPFRMNQGEGRRGASDVLGA